MSKSFTLIELLVVIAIIGLLSTVVMVSVGGTQKKSRDAKRIADMKALQQAVEMYQVANGVYPQGCRGYNAWSSHAPGYGDCDANYITGISSYISKLPIDPRWDSGGSGYLYYSANGNDYTLLAHGTMETICGGDPSNACNPPEIRALDRTCCTQATILLGTQR